MRVELVGSEKPDDSILFGLLPQPTELPAVTLIGGSPGGLADFSNLVTSLTTARMGFQLLVPEASLDIIPIPARAISYQSLAQIESDITIIGPGLKLTSQSQILLDRWLMADKMKSINCDELLTLIKINRSLLKCQQSNWIFTMANIVKLSGKTALNNQPADGLQTVAQLCDKLQIGSDWMAIIQSGRVYIWLPASSLLLHTPVSDQLCLSEIKSILILSTLLIIYRRRLSLDSQTAWRVVLWLIQQNKSSQDLTQQTKLTLNSLQV